MHFRMLDNSTSKPVLAVDVDEVLAHLIPTLADFHNEHYGGDQLTSESFKGHEFHRVWGGSREETSKKVIPKLKWFYH